MVDQKKKIRVWRTTFLEPLFYTFLEKWLQIKWLNAISNWSLGSFNELEISVFLPIVFPKGSKGQLFGPLKDLVTKIKISCERKCIDQITKGLFDVQISHILVSLPNLRQSTTFTLLGTKYCHVRSLWQILYLLITTYIAKNILIKEKNSAVEEF